MTWDNIRFIEDRNVFERTQLAHHISNLRSKHGDYRYQFDRIEEGTEIGTYGFADGQSISQ